MNSDQIDLVRTTWRQVATLGDAAGDLFYKRLFQVDPMLRMLFADDLAEQKKKLLRMIGNAVALLDQPDKLVPAVQELGRRHAGYGVKEPHYATVGSALLWTLEQGLGEAWTPEVKDAWLSTYTLLSQTMVQAAYPKAA